MIHLYFQILNPIRSRMSAEDHHASPASSLRAAQQHIPGDNYPGPITGDMVVVGGRGNTYILGQGRSPPLSRSRYLKIMCRRPALKRCRRNRAASANSARLGH